MTETRLTRCVNALTPIAGIVETACKWLSAAGMVIFMGMVMITFSDVFLRYIFNSSISGTVEVTELLMAIVVFSSIAYAQWTKNHVVMDILIERLSEERRTVVEYATLMWSMAVVLLSIYTATQYAMKTRTMTAILGIDIKPFVYFVAFGFCTLLVTLIWDFLKAAAKVSQLGGKSLFWGSLFGILPIVAGWWIAAHRIPGMSTLAVGVVGIVVMLLLFLSGMPVAFALMATGFIFSGAIRGLGASMNMYGKAMFSTSASYSWSPLMFFMLMGYFCFHAGFGKDIYLCARRWLGHFRGGLAQGSVVACSAFGAVVGDVLSGSIAMSAIALPEMRRNNYDDALAVGTLSCSSSIGALIPPSATFILYGVLAEQSIADLFMAGVVPGILCTLFFMAAIWLMVYRRPEIAPRMPREPLSNCMESMRATLPILVLFVLVIGGIYGGIFTPTEGGGVGAAGTLILAVIMRRLTWSKLIQSFNDSAKYITMCFTVLTGATVLGYLMTLSRIPQVLAGGIMDMGMPGWLTMLAIILALLVLGCFIPAMPLLLVCVPIFVPIAKVFQWDLIWFGVIITLMVNMAGITPPFGINLFVMKGLAKVPIGVMYRASVPFVVALFLVSLLVLLLPATATWLPMVLRG